MKNRTILYLALAAIAFGVIGLAASGASRPFQAVRSTSDATGIDSHFIEEMVPHHDDAIEMARMARTMAEHDELRQLAAVIEREQSAENRRMREWYREWNDTEVPEDGSGMGMMMQGMAGTDMEALETAKPFDKEFIEQMVPHHRMAIMMSRMAGARASTDEIRSLTDSIMQSQAEQIDIMLRWYDEWYGGA